MAEDINGLVNGMTLDQYQAFLNSLMAQRGTGFYDAGDFFQATDPNALTNSQTLGYNPLTGFNYTNEFGGSDNIFTPQDVFGVETERTLAERSLAEQQAAQEAAAAAAANQPGIGSKIGYGLLGAVTGIPGGLIQSGVNALGNLGGQNVVEGGMLPTYYTIGAPTGYVDAAGNALNPDTGLPYDMTGAGMIGGGGGGVSIPKTASTPTTTPTTGTTTGTGEGPGEVLVADPFQVTASGLPQVTLGSGLTSTGITGGGTPGGGGGGNIVQMPGVTVTDTKVPPTGTLAPWLLQQSGYVYDPATGKYTMPTVKVTPPSTSTPTSTLNTSNVSFTDALKNFKTTSPIMGPTAPTSTPSSKTTDSTSTSTGATGTTGTDLGLGSLVGTATNLGTSAQRDFAKELAASRAALQAEQGNLMGMYGGIYQNLLNQTAIPQAAQQSLAQMQADAAKLQRAQSGYLNAEDVRQAQQGAREAYAARGQLMGPGAIGAEILNREAIRQQRENEARAGYQASMGNVFNAAQLQTGNIFSPIGNLVSGTFNPLGAYPQDVYSTNVNAQLARDISAANNAAAIEAAKYGAAASQKAATTGAVGNVLGKLLPSIFR